MISVHLGLSYQCNMNCSHCYVKEKEKNGAIIRPDQFEQLFMKLKLLGSFSITYTMGETLLYPYFTQFAKMAKEQGFYQILLSNGSLLQTESDIDSIVNLGIKRVGISLDSCQEAVHDRNRHYKGAYRMALNAFSLLAKCPDIDVQMLSTISESNFREVDELLSIGMGMHVRDFSFLWMRKNGMLTPIADYKAYSKMITKLIMLHASGKVRINIHDYRVNPILSELLQEKAITETVYREFLSMNHCHASDEMILISPGGEMFSCNFAKKPFANLFTNNIQEISQMALRCKAFCTE